MFSRPTHNGCLMLFLGSWLLGDGVVNFAPPSRGGVEVWKREGGDGGVGKGREWNGGWGKGVGKMGVEDMKRARSRGVLVVGMT